MADIAIAIPTMSALTPAVHELNPGDAGGFMTEGAAYSPYVTAPLPGSSRASPRLALSANRAVQAFGVKRRSTQAKWWAL